MTAAAAGGSDLPPLREVIARHGLSARKSLGQHFLLDPHILARIAHAAGELTGRTVLEVGPGPGGLTRALLAAGAGRVVAVERDPRCVGALHELAERAAGRLRIVEADALEVDEAALAPPPLTVVANLPYNIATPLLLKWLGRLHLFAGFTLMVQKEVAERLAAAPRSKAYGRLSVMVQWRSEVTRLFDLPARAFVPPPKVASSLIRIAPRPPSAVAEADSAAMERVVAAAFEQRRKMLRAALRTLMPDPEPLLAAAGIAPTARAEQLDVAAFAALARAYAAGISAAAAPGTGGRTRSGPADGGGAAARRRERPGPGRRSARDPR